jgi:hypothetical protein
MGIRHSSAFCFQLSAFHLLISGTRSAKRFSKMRAAAPEYAS